jgi:hypothetical protein
MTYRELIPVGDHRKIGLGPRKIVWAVCLIVLCLCCSNAAPQQDQATLYFFNTSSWKVFPEKLTLLDHDKKIAAPNRERYVVLQITPGHHALRLKDERSTNRSIKHEVDLDAMPGVTYYIAGGFYPGMYSSDSTWTLAEISKDEADQLLAEMKPQSEK